MNRNPSRNRNAMQHIALVVLLAASCSAAGPNPRVDLAARRSLALGKKYASEGRLDAAFAAFHRVLEADPLNGDAADGLADALSGLRAINPDFTLSIPFDLVVTPGLLSDKSTAAAAADKYNQFRAYAATELQGAEANSYDNRNYVEGLRMLRIAYLLHPAPIPVSVSFLGGVGRARRGRECTIY